MSISIPASSNAFLSSSLNSSTGLNLVFITNIFPVSPKSNIGVAALADALTAILANAAK